MTKEDLLEVLMEHNYQEQKDIISFILESTNTDLQAILEAFKTSSRVLQEELDCFDEEDLFKMLKVADCFRTALKNAILKLSERDNLDP